MSDEVKVSERCPVCDGNIPCHHCSDTGLSTYARALRCQQAFTDLLKADQESIDEALAAAIEQSMRAQVAEAERDELARKVVELTRPISVGGPTVTSDKGDLPARWWSECLKLGPPPWPNAPIVRCARELYMAERKVAELEEQHGDYTAKLNKANGELWQQDIIIRQQAETINSLVADRDAAIQSVRDSHQDFVVRSASKLRAQAAEIERLRGEIVGAMTIHEWVADHLPDWAYGRKMLPFCWIFGHVWTQGNPAHDPFVCWFCGADRINQ